MTFHPLTWLWVAIYFVLLITLGVISFRKGHWILGIIGFFIPLLWLIGALLPPTGYARR